MPETINFQTLLQIFQSNCFYYYNVHVYMHTCEVESYNAIRRIAF